MPHIELHNHTPGIRGLLQYRPETGRPVIELVEALLRGPSRLSRGERELIAAYVSYRNECRFCAWSHGAFAAAQLEDGAELVEQVRDDLDGAPVPPKLAACCASPRRCGATAGRSPPPTWTRPADLAGCCGCTTGCRSAWPGGRTLARADPHRPTGARRLLRDRRSPASFP
jgi:AhpD family alkylhydroperoxidase